MMQQYLSIKERYPDALLFYRMGDFYEMFFEDAQVASRVLEITLTSRNKHDESPVPMCGVPYRAAQGYISRLIENGYKVAICDQVEDPKAAKGLVKREVVRVVTPGMIIEDELLDAKTNNFILALSRHQHMTGLASLDISTGTFRLTETADMTAIIDEIMRVAPREILLPESLKADAAFTPFFKGGPHQRRDRHGGPFIRVCRQPSAAAGAIRHAFTGRFRMRVHESRRGGRRGTDPVCQ